jgi:Flp pilus assembly protein TadG
MASMNGLRRWKCEKGAELIEFALVFPLLLLTVMGIIDFGFLFQRYEVVVNAAREGARIAVLPGYAQPDVQQRISDYLTAGGATATPTVTFQAPQAVNVGGACITLTGVTVAYPHTYTFVGPIASFFSTSLAGTTLTATARMRYEGAAMTCP